MADVKSTHVGHPGYVFLVTQSLQIAQDYSPGALSEHLRKAQNEVKKTEETFPVLTILIWKLTLTHLFIFQFLGAVSFAVYKGLTSWY